MISSVFRYQFVYNSIDPTYTSSVPVLCLAHNIPPLAFNLIPQSHRLVQILKLVHQGGV